MLTSLWAGTATANGTVSISGTGLVTVTGVAAGTSSTATITTTKDRYQSGSRTVSATSLPSCSVSTSTSNGYTIVRITSTVECSFATPSGVSGFEVAVVGGGGGGGFGNLAGGGGAGEVLVYGSTTLSNGVVSGSGVLATAPGTRYLVKVGTGGTSGAPTGATELSANWSAQSATATFGGNGTNTIFGGVTATGGGGGGGGGSAQTLRAAGAAGGSGGGASLNALGGAAGTSAVPSGWTTYRNRGSDGSNGNGGGAGGAGTTRGGAGISLWGIKLAGGGGGWGVLGAENSLTDTVLGGNGRLTTGVWPYAGTAPNYTSPGTNGTGTGGGAGAPGGSGVVIIRYANTYTLTYNYNSADGGDSTASDDFTTGGTAITLPVPTLSNFIFAGWFTNSNFTGSALGLTYSPTSSLTLYAKWNANSATVTFNANSGSGTMTDQSIPVSTATNLSTNLFARDNYTFAGWNTQSDGNGTAYTNAESVTLTSGLTLYAQWTANQYTVTYNYNSATGGNGTVSSSFTTGGSAITLPTPTRTGYTFGGWYSDLALTTSIGAAGASYSPTGATLALAAYAKWTAINYTITYDSNSATSGTVPTDATNYNIGQNITVKANSGSLTRTGYTFAGWNTAANGSGDTYLSGTQYEVGSANVTLYAKWNANTYTVTYNKNGANGSPQRSSNNVTTDSYTTGGNDIVLPSVGTMSKTGYDFAGWATTPTGATLSGGFNTSTNVTLYAIWDLKNIAISFSKGIASAATINNFPADTTAQYGSTLTLNSTLTSTVVINGSAHAFVGWSYDGSIYQGGTTFLVGETAPTFTAEWVKVFAVRYAFNGGTPANSTSEVDSECLFVDGADLRCTENQEITSNAAPTKAGYTFAGWVDQNGQSVGTAATFSQ